jgi:hypothetical protein
MKIEKDIPITRAGRPRKYQKYIDVFNSMGLNESFVVHDYKIVDSIKYYAWKRHIKMSFRTIAREKYRIWKFKTMKLKLTAQ